MKRVTTPKLLFAVLVSVLFVGEALGQATAVKNATRASLGVTEGRPSSIAVDDAGALQLAASKAEDAASADGDPGVFALGVRNNANSPVVRTSADGDYAPISVNGRAAVYVEMNRQYQESSTDGLIKSEDASVAGGDAGVSILGQRQDTLSNSTSTDGDWGTFKLDSVGRQYVNAWGGDVSQFWQACSSAATGTTDTAIKAAVASNRIYVTAISCDNTATVASAIAFKDGTTQIYRGAIGNSTLDGVGSFVATLPTPLRLTSNTALNFAMGTTGTSTTCCAAGFIAQS